MFKFLDYSRGSDKYFTPGESFSPKVGLLVGRENEKTNEKGRNRRSVSNCCLIYSSHNEPL